MSHVCEKAERNEAIARMRASGYSYSYLAQIWGITRQRAHQIVEAVRDQIDRRNYALEITRDARERHRDCGFGRHLVEGPGDLRGRLHHRASGSN